MGRPKAHIDTERAEELASLGLSLEQVASALGVSSRTLRAHKADDNDLRDAIERGQARGIAKVAEALMELGLSGNASALIFYLKARAGWSDRVAIDHTTGGHEIPTGLGHFYPGMADGTNVDRCD